MDLFIQDLKNNNIGIFDIEVKKTGDEILPSSIIISGINNDFNITKDIVIDTSIKHFGNVLAILESGGLHDINVFEFVYYYDITYYETLPKELVEMLIVNVDEDLYFFRESSLYVDAIFYDELSIKRIIDLKYPELNVFRSKNHYYQNLYIELMSTDMQILFSQMRNREISFPITDYIDSTNLYYKLRYIYDHYYVFRYLILEKLIPPDVSGSLRAAIKSLDLELLNYLLQHPDLDSTINDGGFLMEVVRTFIDYDITDYSGLRLILNDPRINPLDADALKEAITEDKHIVIADILINHPKSREQLDKIPH